MANTWDGRETLVQKTNDVISIAVVYKCPCQKPCRPSLEVSENDIISDLGSVQPNLVSILLEAASLNVEHNTIKSLTSLPYTSEHLVHAVSKPHALKVMLCARSLQWWNLEYEASLNDKSFKYCWSLLDLAVLMGKQSSAAVLLRQGLCTISITISPEVLERKPCRTPMIFLRKYHFYMAKLSKRLATARASILLQRCLYGPVLLQLCKEVSIVHKVLDHFCPRAHFLLQASTPSTPMKASKASSPMKVSVAPELQESGAQVVNVIQDVVHMEPAAIRDSDVLLDEAQLAWVDAVEQSILRAHGNEDSQHGQHVPAEHGFSQGPGEEADHAIEAIFLLRFGSASAGEQDSTEQFRARLLDGPQLRLCRDYLEEKGFNFVLPGGSLMAVWPHQYREVCHTLAHENIELHPFHVIVTESLEHLIAECLQQMPSKKRPRLKPGDRGRQALPIVATTFMKKSQPQESDSADVTTIDGSLGAFDAKLPSNLRSDLCGHTMVSCMESYLQEFGLHFIRTCIAWQDTGIQLLRISKALLLPSQFTMP